MEYNMILIRHAQALDRAASGKDFDRALHPRGIQALASLCRRWPPSLPHPQKILCSPAVRTRETARELSRGLGLDPGNILEIDALYLAEPDQLEFCLYSLDPSVRTVCLVGHNPGITHWFQSWPPPPGQSFLPPCAMVSIRFEAEDWGQFSLATKTITHIDIPNSNP